jgi:hypothetical protein
MKTFRAIGLMTVLVGCATGGHADETSLEGSGGNQGDDGGRSGGAPVEGGQGAPSDAPSGAMWAWTATVGRKIQPTTAPGPGRAIAVESYRDAWVSAQIAVRSSGGALRGVTAGVDADLTDGRGHALARENVTLFREHFIDFAGLSPDIANGNVPVPANSPTGDGKAPDPLVPLVDPYTGKNAGQPFDVPQSVNQPLFVDIHVPKGLPSGTYTGKVRIEATEDGSAAHEEDVPISVTVWALDLPDMRSVATHFRMTANDLYDFHRGVGDCTGTSCYLDPSKPQTRTLLQRYEDLAHAHRIDTGQALVRAPVDGCTAPTPTDWAAYDAAMQPYMDGSYFGDRVPSGRFDVPFSPGVSDGIDGKCGEDEYEALARAWASHLADRGWFPRPAGGGFGAVVYALDEPLAAQGDASDVQRGLDRIVRNSTWLQQGASGTPSPWKSHVIDTVSPIAAPAEPATTPLLDPALGVYVVGLMGYGPSWGREYYGRRQWQQSPDLFAEGMQLWFYESNSVRAPYPTFATNTLDALEPVIMMWGSWYERATGFLYWDISYWAGGSGTAAKDPWGPAIDFGKTGDGTLVYPGNHDGAASPAGSPADVALDGPIPSYRLKMIRQGLQDWALFRYADAKGLRAFVQQQVGRVYSQFGGTAPAPSGSPYWTTDEDAMVAIRRAVVAKILAP